MSEATLAHVDQKWPCSWCAEKRREATVARIREGQRVLSTVLHPNGKTRWEDRPGTIEITVPGVQYAIRWDDGGSTCVTLGTEWALTIADGLRPLEQLVSA